MRVTQRIPIGPPIDDDDEDDDLPHVLPPEIQMMMRQAEQMHQGFMGGFFGKPKKEIERHDESTEDIMKRMNALSEEIGEKHEQTKYDLSLNKNERILQVSVMVMFLVFILVASFVLSCMGDKKALAEEEDDGKRARTVEKQS